MTTVNLKVVALAAIAALMFGGCASRDAMLKPAPQSAKASVKDYEYPKAYGCSGYFAGDDSQRLACRDLIYGHVTTGKEFEGIFRLPPLSNTEVSAEPKNYVPSDLQQIFKAYGESWNQNGGELALYDRVMAWAASAPNLETQSCKRNKWVFLGIPPVPFPAPDYGMTFGCYHSNLLGSHTRIWEPGGTDLAIMQHYAVSNGIDRYYGGWASHAPELSLLGKSSRDAFVQGPREVEVLLSDKLYAESLCSTHPDILRQLKKTGSGGGSKQVCEAYKSNMVTKRSMGVLWLYDKDRNHFKANGLAPFAGADARDYYLSLTGKTDFPKGAFSKATDY